MLLGWLVVFVRQGRERVGNGVFARFGTVCLEALRPNSGFGAIKRGFEATKSLFFGEARQ